MMNVYGKEASAYYDAFTGLRHLKRGEKSARPIATEKNDTLREELEEFGRCVRHGGEPETGGLWATRNLAVIKAGLRSAREGRVIAVADVVASGE
jgi:predicted dehydrogenase